MGKFKKMTPEEKKQYQFEKKKELDEKLAEGIQAIFEDGRFADYLKLQACFHKYSVNNTILILLQEPDATYVAGAGTWKKLNRRLVKDARAIRIYAHMKDKKYTKKEVSEDGEEEVVTFTSPMFTTTCVYNISETVGEDGSEELPGEIVHTLYGDIEDYDEFMEKLQNAVGITFEFKDIPGGANGYYSRSENRIVIQKGMSQKQTVKTAVHEAAHSRFHYLGSEYEKADRETKEMQAEGAAYMICQYFGIDTSDYSFGYIAGWSSDKTQKERQEVLGTIRSTAFELIEAIEA